MLFSAAFSNGGKIQVKHTSLRNAGFRIDDSEPGEGFSPLSALFQSLFVDKSSTDALVASNPTSLIKKMIL